MQKKTEKENKSEIFEEVTKRIQDKEHKEILRNFFIISGFIFLLVISFIFVGNFKSSFDYKGVKFQIVDEIAPYRTSVLVTTEDSITGAVVTGVPYYFYMRNSPNDLEKVEFKEDLELRNNLLIKSDEDFTCDGYGTIGIINLANLYNKIGISVVRDESANCDNSGRYMLLEIESGETTEIEKIGSACYVMRINNCEILPATEKFMVETLIEYNRIKSQSEQA